MTRGTSSGPTPHAVPIPGSTVSWSCVEIDAAGNVVPGFSDGLNGGVTMPIGTFVRCEAVNQTARMSLVKEVINDSGGTAVPGELAAHGHAGRSRGPGSGPGDGHGLGGRNPVRGQAWPGLPAQ